MEGKLDDFEEFSSFYQNYSKGVFQNSVNGENENQFGSVKLK